MEIEIPRKEHLTWCKVRAMEYLNAGDVRQGWLSFSSDMSKHSETADHPALSIGRQLFFAGLLQKVDAMKKFINDFN